jgi:hypothetical protein
MEGFVYDPSCYCYVWGSECFTDCYEVTDYPGVTTENGVLSFDSNQSLYDLVTDLSNSVELHNANFYDSKDAMTDEQVDAISEQQNFDEYKPLRDFETYFGFSSLRAKIENDENIWLANPVLNDATDPDNLYKEQDDVVRRLLNLSGDIKVAGITYNLSSTETQESGESSYDCKSHSRYQIPKIYDNNNKRLKFVAAYDGYYALLGGTRINAKTKSFKKKNNGNWKRFAVFSNAQIGGQIVNSNCVDPQSFISSYKPQKRRQTSRSERFRFAGYSQVKSGEMSS